MIDVRSSGTFSKIFFLILFVLALSLFLPAQESAREKEKEKEAKKKAASANLVNIKGKLRCDKPNPNYALDVPDRPGHSLILEERKCTWTEPFVILGGKTRGGVWMAFIERKEGGLDPHTFEVDTLNDGEKITFQTILHVSAEKGPTTIKGRFSFMRGTGKYKGIKGGGTMEGSLGADDVITFDLEGVYEPSEMDGGKK
jgi:hypothetical protein